jgi:putative transposase
VKRRRGRWYAVFVFDVKPREEPPAEVVAFDVNENWVAVAKVRLWTESPAGTDNT